MPDFTDDLKPHPQSDGAATLAKERAQSSLSVDEISHHLFDRDGFLERQQRVLSVLEREPVFNKTNQLNLARPDRYHLGLARAKMLRRLSEKHGWDFEDDKMSAYLVDETSPYHLHVNMFTTCIREQASEEQRKYWLPLSEKYKIIGAYAQTELGHGSNVQGLELEARYDPATKEFVLHSPHLTASKWWNGTLGRTANHAIVVAQLLLPETGPGGRVEYKSFGPHPFVVQIRDLKTHQPFEGVVIGDIGPKYGYWCMDNGYMLFKNFRIPHSAFLSRYAKVDPETGKYEKPEHRGVVYGTMTFVRSNIVMHARLVLARVATVAVRYTAIRRQFHDRDGGKSGPEMAVLDYPSVQIRVLPLLATAFALHYNGHAMWGLYWRTREKIEGGDFSELTDLHSTSSGLKSLCTTLAADGIETGRRVLGGHGFGAGSGLIQLNNDYHSKVTVEGENWMITQQVASYLIKKVTAVVASPDTPPRDDTERMLKEFYALKKNTFRPATLDVLNDPKAVLEAFDRRAADLSFKAYEARVVQKRKWTSLLIKLHKLSNARSQAIIVRHFYTALSTDYSLAPQTKSVLWDLYWLFALFTMDNESREFFNSGAVSNDQLEELPDKIQDLMARIRPHAVKLVDAWKIPEFLLDSALGRYDGKVYEDLFNRAHRLNPLNKITFNPNYWEDELVKDSGDGGPNGTILAKL